MSEDGTKRRTDNPIEAAAEDRLERAEVAKSFVGHVLGLDASRGLTVGVYGPWGSGKTSFVNLALSEFERRKVPTLAFNPWMFSDAEQLVARFFAELSASLGKRAGLKEVGQEVAKYGGAIVGTGELASMVFSGAPGLGKVLLTPVLKIVAKASEGKGIAELRNGVEAELGKQDRPVVVVLDDVDRLTFEEVREVLKLVRLTASFPNLVYILVCDRHRVEQALDGQGTGDGFGREYLEKIVQYPFDVPAVPRHLLRRELEEELTEALAGLDLRPFDRSAWAETYREVIEPLIRNLRDVRRFITAALGTATVLAGEVEMADLLGLEAIRVFLPGVFRRLHGAIDAITYPSRSRSDERAVRELWHGQGKSNLQPKEKVQDLVDAGGDRAGVVEAAVKTLFPYGYRTLTVAEGTDRRENTSERDPATRRVADEAVLRLYLEGVAGEDIGVLKSAEKALRSLSDAASFEHVLRSLDSREVVDVLGELCRLSDRFEPAHAEPGVVVLLNLLPEMPDEGSFWRTPRQVVRAASFRLLRSAGDKAAVAAVTDGILPQLRLGGKVELVHLVGHSKYEEERLVTPEVSTALNTRLVEEIRSAFERDEIDAPEEYAWIVSFPARVGQRIELPDSAAIAFRLAHSAVAISHSDTGTSKSPDWEFLALLYGDKATAVSRMSAMCATFDAQAWGGELARWRISTKEAEETLTMVREGLLAEERSVARNSESAEHHDGQQASG